LAPQLAQQRFFLGLDLDEENERRADNGESRLAFQTPLLQYGKPQSVPRSKRTKLASLITVYKRSVGLGRQEDVEDPIARYLFTGATVAIMDTF